MSKLSLNGGPHVLTVSAPPEYRLDAAHLISSSSWGVTLRPSSKFVTKLGTAVPLAYQRSVCYQNHRHKKREPWWQTHHLVEHKLVRLIGHIDQRFPPLACDLMETTAWEPFRDVAEPWEEVDGEETGGEKDVELVRRLVSDADQLVVFMFGSVTVGYPKDDDAHRPRKRNQ